MIKNEWKHLLKNKILVVVVIAIIVIPVIYAGLFLKSMWDPYGNLDQLPVAVVNKDKAVEYEGKTLSVGSDMEDALRDNDSLDFHFVAQYFIQRHRLDLRKILPDMLLTGHTGHD